MRLFAVQYHNLFPNPSVDLEGMCSRDAKGTKCASVTSSALNAEQARLPSRSRGRRRIEESNPNSISPLCAWLMPSEWLPPESVNPFAPLTQNSTSIFAAVGLRPT